MSLSSITRKPIFVVYLGGFIYSIHLALTIYINSSYLSTIFTDTLTGVLFSISAVLTIAGLAILPHFIKKLGEKKVLLLGIIVNILMLAGLTLMQNPILVGILFVIYFSMNTLILFGIDVAIEDVSPKKKVGTLRGLFLTLKHVALMIAPLAAGFIIDRFGYNAVYGLAGITMLITFISFIRLRNLPEPKYKERPLFSAIHHLRKSKDMLLVFFANFLLRVFFAWMIIYAPLHLIENIGMKWSAIGGLLTIMLAAFVIFEYPFGKIADKPGASRPLLVIGFLIMAGSVAIIPFVSTASFIIWALILFTTRIGAAAVEVTTEAYFFKHTNPEDISTMSLFRDTHPLAYLVAPIIASIFLNLFSLQYIFLALGCIMLIGVYIALRLPKYKKNTSHAH